MIGKTVSHYKIIEKLGAGGMGEVYKAEDLKLERTVALKFLPSEYTRDDEAKDRFIREAKAASSLEHPNICTIHEINETDDGQLYIVMSCYEGETLKAKIKDQGLKIKEAVNYAIQIAEGLAKAHDKGIVHRDIKPANILITNDGIVKILDFGLAKLAGEIGVTKTDTTVGTVAYMSPEQIEGESVDHRSDIWSLGAVMYEMISGRKPFKGDYDQAVIYSILNEEPKSLADLRSDVPLELDRIVKKSLTKNADVRYQHIDDLVMNLKNLQRTLRTEETVTEPSQDSSKAVYEKVSKRKKQILIPVTIIVSVIVMVGLAWIIMSRKSLPLEPAKEKSVAVLPFAAITQAEEDIIFSDGIHDDIITQLAKIKDLKVIARTSVLGYRNTEKRVRDIAEELGVKVILEGSVRRVGNQVRIVAQLVDGKTESHLWTNTYDKNYQDIFAVQSDVAEQIARALKATLTPAEKDFIAQKPTTNMEAYDYYMKGKYYWDNYQNLEGNQRAVENYEKAIALDSSFGLAYARLAIVCFELAYSFKHDVTTNRTKGENALTKAVELVADHPLTNIAQSHYYRVVERDNEKALKLIKRALDLYPNDAEIHLTTGYQLVVMRKLEEAIDYFKKEYELNPLGPISGSWVAATYGHMRDWDEAIIWSDRYIAKQPQKYAGYVIKSFIYANGYGKLDEAIAILDEGFRHVEDEFDQPYSLTFQKCDFLIRKRSYQQVLKFIKSGRETPTGTMMVALALDLMGKSEKAALYYDSTRIRHKKQISANPYDSWAYSKLGIAYAGLGNKEKAIHFGKKAVELEPIPGSSLTFGEVVLSALVYILVKVGEYDEACEHLETLLKLPSGRTVWWLKQDPWFDPIRDRPCFQRLLREYSQE